MYKEIEKRHIQKYTKPDLGWQWISPQHIDAGPKRVDAGLTTPRVPATSHSSQPRQKDKREQREKAKELPVSLNRG